MRATRAGPGWLLPAAWAAVLTLAILWPVLFRPGYALSYDMVFVPDQTLKPWMWGAGDAPPRAVPQDVYIAVLDNAVPGWLLQRLLLCATFLVAGLGVAALLRPLGTTAQLVATTFYVWSPYVFERLVIGHWGLLIAFAVLPWVLLVGGWARAGSRAAGGALVVLSFAGTWVPTGGVLVTALALAILAWRGPTRRPRWVIVCLVAVQLTWLVPALAAASLPQVSDSSFATRGDGGSGVVLTALAGSGIWNPAVLPASREGPLGWAAGVAAVLVVAVGLQPLVRGLGRPRVLPLLLVGAVGLAWAVLTGLPFAHGAVSWAVGLPGGGLLRDGQKWLAPWWLLVSLAAGSTAAQLGTRWRERGLASLAGLLALVPLVLLPDLVAGASGRLSATQYPEDWRQVSRILAAVDDGSVVVSLPWSAFRRYAWNAERVVLDPAPRFLPGDVRSSSDLLLGGSGGLVTLPSDDPAAGAVGAALRAPDPAADLARLGIGWVLIQRDQPPGPLGEDLSLLAGPTAAYRGPWLSLHRTAAPTQPIVPAPGFPWPTWLLVLGVVAAGGAAAATGVRAWARDGC